MNGLQASMGQVAPALSVVVPIHNGAKYIAETLAAIFGQTFDDFEVLLVDDASTDNLSESLTGLSDPRLRIIQLQSNVGVANARNTGVDLARGRYIAFCDADDICHPRRFEYQIGYLNDHPGIGACGTAFTCFSGSQDLKTVENPTSDGDVKAALMIGNCFGMSTMMGRSEIFKANPFDQAMSPTEDYDLWTRLASAGVKMANLSESLVRYRIHANQASKQKSALLDRLSRKIRAIYCARLLSSDMLVQRVRSEQVSVEDLLLAAELIGKYCGEHNVQSAHQFRFMLAWLYQKIPQHGISAWWSWVRVQSDLGLQLDINYRFNIALLALLPIPLVRARSDVLLKLKR